jgi:hypothetical protein
MKIGARKTHGIKPGNTISIRITAEDAEKRRGRRMIHNFSAQLRVLRVLRG